MVPWKQKALVLNVMSPVTSYVSTVSVADHVEAVHDDALDDAVLARTAGYVSVAAATFPTSRSRLRRQQAAHIAQSAQHVYMVCTQARLKTSSERRAEPLIDRSDPLAVLHRFEDK
eukprot:3332599-Rhodomonas_salina.1